MKDKGRKYNEQHHFIIAGKVQGHPPVSSETLTLQFGKGNSGKPVLDLAGYRTQN